ncbi:TniQ family protein [Aliiroseovarius sp. CAU 1755]
MRLRLSVAPFPGEPANSVVSRIAARNGASFVQDFCADMNASWREIANGERVALSDMAALAGISFTELSRFAVQDRGHHIYDLNDQYLTAKTLDRRALKVCPSCLIDDVKIGGDLDRHCRVEWLLNSYQVCHIHGRPMLTLADADFPRCAHDFYQRIRDHWRYIVKTEELDDLAVGDVAWEAYVANRIRGEPTHVWCDRFDLDFTCHLAVNLGTVMLFGSSKNPSELKPKEKSSATAQAFAALEKGPEALCDALHAVRKASASPTPGFKADFGALARWLCRADYDNPRLAELLDCVVQFAFENYPFGEGDELFGRKCQQRRIHNLTTAAKQHHLNYSRMASLAVGLGIGTEDRQKRIEFSAQKYDPILEQFAQCIRPKPAAKSLGIRVEALQRLAKATLLQPRFDLPAMAPVYHPDDLDRFKQSIFENAEVVPEISPNCIPLFRLCQHAKCHFEEVIRIAQSGKLRSLCRSASARSIHDCFADLEDLRDQLEGPTHKGHTKQEAKRMLRINDPTVTLLVRKSLLPVRMVRHPRSRRPMGLISSTALSAFLNEYATLGMMAYAANTQAKHVATRLEKAGIEPLPLGDRFSKIYRRSAELENLFPPGRIT